MSTSGVTSTVDNNTPWGSSTSTAATPSSTTGGNRRPSRAAQACARSTPSWSELRNALTTATVPTSSASAGTAIWLITNTSTRSLTSRVDERIAKPRLRVRT
jgi:hypothetical protein